MKDAAKVLDCPHCGTGTKVPTRLYGKKVRCPRCKDTFVAGSEPKLDELEEVKEDDINVGAPPRVKKRYVDDDEDDDDRPRKGRRNRRSASTSNGAPAFYLDGRKLALGIFGVVFGFALVAGGSMSSNRGGAYGAGQSAAFGMGLLFLLVGIGTVIGAFVRR